MDPPDHRQVRVPLVKIPPYPFHPQPPPPQLFPVGGEGVVLLKRAFAIFKLFDFSVT